MSFFIDLTLNEIEFNLDSETGVCSKSVHPLFKDGQILL